MPSAAAPWRATYTPGNWLVLSGPTCLVVMMPAPARMSGLLNQLWDQMVAANSVDALLELLSSYGMDAMPDLAAFFWDDKGLHGIARGALRVYDAISGETVIDGADVVTWREENLEPGAQLRIDMEPVDVTQALQLPLVVGAVSASAVYLNPSDQARVRFPDAETTGILPQVDSLAEASGTDVEIAPEPEPEDYLDAEILSEEAVKVVNEPGPGGPSAVLPPRQAPELESQPSAVPPPTEPEATDEDLADAHGVAAAPESQPKAEAEPVPVDPELEIDAAPEPEPEPESFESPEPDPEPEPEIDSGEAPAPEQFSLDDDPEQAVEAQAPAEPEDTDDGSYGTGSLDFEVGELHDAPNVVPGKHVAEDDDDDDGGTVFSTDIAATHKPAAPTNQAQEMQVLAAWCPNRHPNPAGAGQCRICQQPVDSSAARLVERPLIAGVNTNFGEFINIERGVVVGRSPDAAKGPKGAYLMRVVSPSSDISRSHLMLTTQDWDVVVTDLHSTNGSTIRPIGDQPFILANGQSVHVGLGTVIDLGDGVSLRIESPRTQG